MVAILLITSSFLFKHLMGGGRFKTTDIGCR